MPSFTLKNATQQGLTFTYVTGGVTYGYLLGSQLRYTFTADSLTTDTQRLISDGYLINGPAPVQPPLAAAVPKFPMRYAGSWNVNAFYELGTVVLSGSNYYLAILSSTGVATSDSNYWSHFSLDVSALDASNITSGILGAAYGGAGTISGLLKANGSGVVSAAAAGTDYLSPSGSGASLTALNATQLTTGTVAAARGGAGAVSGVLKADGAGLVSAAVAGTDFAGLTTNTFTGLNTANKDALAVTQSDSFGFALTNNTAAISGTQQISPSIRWRGQAWKTAVTAASQSVDFRAYVLPVQGVTATGTWQLQASINGASYANVFTVGSAGNVASTGAFTANGTITATGALSGSSLNISGSIATVNLTASGLVSGAGMSTAGSLSVAGVVNGGSISTSGNVSASSISADIGSLDALTVDQTFEANGNSAESVRMFKLGEGGQTTILYVHAGYDASDPKDYVLLVDADPFDASVDSNGATGASILIGSQKGGDTDISSGSGFYGGSGGEIRFQAGDGGDCTNQDASEDMNGGAGGDLVFIAGSGGDASSFGVGEVPGRGGFITFQSGLKGSGNDFNEEGYIGLNLDGGVTKVGHAAAFVGGTLYRAAGSAVGNLNGAETVLWSNSIVSGTFLSREGVSFKFSGTFAANGNSKRLKVIYGSTTLFDSGAGAANGTHWTIEGRVEYSGDATECSVVKLTTSTNTLFSTFCTVTSTINEPQNTGRNIQIAATGVASNDIVFRMGRIKFEA